MSLKKKGLSMPEQFGRIKRLPPYVFAIVNTMKIEARRRGEDIIDLGMGNPDQGTPQHIVDKLIEAARNPKNHRYSASKGITKLRTAVCDWYKRRYDVDLDPESETVVTIGSKEGLSHLALATVEPGDVVLTIPLRKDSDFFFDMQEAYKNTWPRPKMLIINFPNNPTTTVVDAAFFHKIADFARENNIIVVHDLAYADLNFDGYRAPSFLQAKGAKDVGVEFFSLTKSYNMAGWRVGFCCGNKDVVGALVKIKSYLDYGMFQPIQIASIIALNGPQECVGEITDMYRSRRDVLIDGLDKAGWKIDKPKATMFVWAEIPEPFRKMGSIEFSKHLIKEAKVAVSPGVGFGEYGDSHVRFALIENEHRLRQAAKGIKQALQ
jgi:alanine-synthesizing transaminase